MPPVKLRGAQRSTFRLQLTTRDTDLSISGRPRPAATLRALFHLDLEYLDSEST